EALRTGEGGAIRTALEELSAAYSAAGSSMYASAGAEGGAPGAGDETGTAGAGAEGEAPEDVVEADYEIVDDSKKP
ncbi:MAG: molecular chaperone DnaK, partial [Gemmatimonadales bacterium]